MSRAPGTLDCYHCKLAMPFCSTLTPHMHIGTVMFLHWLAGMIFIFYLASFVMLLREILRPGVLWFLRNLNDQNFHPINEVGTWCGCIIWLAVFVDDQPTI